MVYATALLYNLGLLGPELPGAVLAGLADASVSLLVPASYTETRLLWAAAAFFLGAIAVCALLDRVLPAAHGLGRGLPAAGGQGTGDDGEADDPGRQVQSWRRQ